MNLHVYSMEDNVVHCVFTFDFRLFFGSFGMMAEHVESNFDGRSNDTFGGPSASVNSVTSESIWHWSLGSRCACWAWCAMLKLVATAPITYCNARDALSYDVLSGRPYASIITDSVVFGRMKYKRSLHSSILG